MEVKGDMHYIQSSRMNSKSDVRYTVTHTHTHTHTSKSGCMDKKQTNNHHLHGVPGPGPEITKERIDLIKEELEKITIIITKSPTSFWHTK